jgi:hypothetical protein
MKNWQAWAYIIWLILTSLWILLNLRKVWLESPKRNKQPQIYEYLHDIFQKLDNLALRINKLEDHVFGVIDIDNNKQLDPGVSFEVNHPLIVQEFDPLTKETRKKKF